MKKKKEARSSIPADPVKDKPKRFAIALLITIIAIGLLFKIAYLYSYHLSNPYYEALQLDSAIYVGWAERIIKEGWLGKEVFYQAPLYPYLLSLFFQVFGHEYLPVYIIQLIMGMALLFLIYLTGKEIFNERSGLIATAFCLAYAPFTFYETKLLTTVTEMLLAGLSMYLLTKAEREKELAFWIAGAATLGLAVICRPNYLFVAPIMIALLAWRYRGALRAMIPRMLIVGLAPLLVVGVVTVRNYVVGEDFVLISSSGGVTFAQGNNPGAKGGMLLLPGFSGSAVDQQREDILLAEKATGKRLKPSEASAYWLGWATGFIREHPLRYLELLWRKAILIFNNRELGNNYLLSIDRELTPVLRLAFLPFGPIMAFAVIGLFAVSRRKLPASAVLATFLGAFLMLLLFYVCTRFRMTLAPAAVVLAGGGLDFVLRRRGDGKPLWPFALLAGFLCVFSMPLFLPMSDAELSAGDAEYWSNLGVAYEKGARHEKALRACERAIELSPSRMKPYRAKTELLKSLGTPKERILAWVGEVTERFPKEPSVHVELADALAAGGKDREAMESYRRAIELNPRLIEARLRLGAALGRTGSHEKAREILAEALKIAPDDILIKYNYAAACFALGERQEAMKYLKEVISHDPELGKARWMMEKLQAGDREQ